MKPIQGAALARELEDANDYVVTGRRLMSEISHVNTFYAGPLLMYAYGFERLMKSALLLRRWEAQGNVPSGKKLSSLSHDLVQLRKAFVAECYEDLSMLGNDLVRQQAKQDHDFLSNDPLLEAFIQTLSSFSTKGRYHHLSIALGLQSHADSPDNLATQLETQVAASKQIEPPAEEAASLDGYYSEITSEINRIAERLHVAIARLFRWGCLGTRGKVHSASSLKDIARHGRQDP
jgi:hypothetical protein